jgi:hypothetical protein
VSENAMPDGRRDGPVSLRREGPTREPHGYRTMFSSDWCRRQAAGPGRPALGAPWARRLPSRRRSAALDRALPDRAWDQHQQNRCRGDQGARSVRPLSGRSRILAWHGRRPPWAGRLTQPCRPVTRHRRRIVR